MVLLVGAIDFGTAYSGWAFSSATDYERDPTIANVKLWHSGLGTLTKEKLQRTKQVPNYEKKIPAVDVFAMSIKYLRDDMMRTVGNHSLGLLQRECIRWFLTVPAIWSDAAKQFMMEAATTTGIGKDHVTIALEPEAASIYCRYFPVDSADVSISKLPPGTKYIVVDAGGDYQYYFDSLYSLFVNDQRKLCQ